MILLKNDQNEILIQRLLNKSIEAFIMGLEIYNKPTIKYKVEGFSFFICNAWELMLKAELLYRKESIYYKNNSRTLSLNEVIKKIYTDKKQPLRLNLESVIDLRNTSTHFVTEDYESIYAPFFQACIMNFVEQIQRFHKIDITDYITSNSLTISVDMNNLNDNEIRGKYTPEISEKMLLHKTNLANLMESNSTNNSLFIPIVNKIFITKNKKDADFQIAISKDSTKEVTIIKEIKDPSKTHTLTFNGVINAVNKQLKAKSIKFNYQNMKGENLFNSYTLNIIINFYQIKSNELYAYHFADQYRYNQKLVDYIVNEINNNSDIIVDIKKSHKKR